MQRRIAWWVRTLKSTWKFPVSNHTRCLTGLGDPTLLWGSWWLLEQKWRKTKWLTSGRRSFPSISLTKIGCGPAKSLWREREKERERGRGRAREKERGREREREGARGREREREEERGRGRERATIFFHAWKLS